MSNESRTDTGRTIRLSIGVWRKTRCGWLRIVEVRGGRAVVEWKDVDDPPRMPDNKDDN